MSMELIVLWAVSCLNGCFYVWRYRPYRWSLATLGEGRGRGGWDVAQWLERRNSNPEDPGFDPLAKEQCFCPSESNLVQTCLRPIPLRVYDTHSNLCAR